MIPIYRGDRLDGLGEIDGYLVRQNNSIHLAIVSGFDVSVIYGLVCPHTIDKETLKISFDNGKSFIKLSELEIHTCTDFELKYTDMNLKDKFKTRGKK